MQHTLFVFVIFKLRVPLKKDVNVTVYHEGNLIIKASALIVYKLCRIRLTILCSERKPSCIYLHTEPAPDVVRKVMG